MRNRILIGSAVLIVVTIFYKVYSGLEEKKQAIEIANLDRQREDSLNAVQALKEQQEYQEKQEEEKRKSDSLNSILFAKQEEEIAKQRELERPFQEVEQKINYLLQINWKFSKDGFIQEVDGDDIEYRFNIRDVDVYYSNGNIWFSCKDRGECIKDDSYKGSTSDIFKTCGEETSKAVEREIKKYRRIIKPI